MIKASKATDNSPVEYHLWRRQRRGQRHPARPARRQGRLSCQMSRLGLPVPPGLTISSEVCTAYYKSGRHSEALMPMVSQALDVVGNVAGARYGDFDNPLLVSVRSGSRASMPGMMDTVLNLGLNDVTVEGLARRSSDPQIRLRHLSPLHSDVRRCGARHRPRSVRGGARELQKPQGLRARYGAQGRALGGGGKSLQCPGRAGARQALPARFARPAMGRDRRGVRILAQCARHRIPAAARYSR